jgi:(p)ppGpp synthase/HD superfamily hydrolase
MTDLVLVARAADFAARAHVNQHRKGRALEPYVNHLAEVAVMLAVATGGTDPVLIAAGWLHDTVEDTDVTHDDLLARFGAEVAGVVAEVTDDKSMPWSERKRRQALDMPAKSCRAQYLKIADQTSNIRALVTTPPVGWDQSRLTNYVDRGVDVMERASERHPRLEEFFWSSVNDARAAFAMRANREEPA